jgi:hypothetical protein
MPVTVEKWKWDSVVEFRFAVMVRTLSTMGVGYSPGCSGAQDITEKIGK